MFEDAAHKCRWRARITAQNGGASIPDHLLGRVGASYRFLVYIGMPFGALAGGFLANAFGIRSALAVNGARPVAPPTAGYGARQMRLVLLIASA